MSNRLLRNLKNIPGYQTTKKILVLESDDWGSIRMPSTEAYEYFVSKGIGVNKNNFTRMDTLANHKDLEDLFEVLAGVKDSRGSNAKLTPFTCLTNPDFKLLKDSNYKEYGYELFTDTIDRYYGSRTFELWKEGIKENLFVPEYHGREHYSVSLLLDLLKDKNQVLLEGCKRECVHLPVQSKRLSVIKNIYPTYFYSSNDDITNLVTNLKEGINLFASVFNREPKCFGPPNGIFSLDLERAFDKSKLKGIVVNRMRIEPTGKGELTKRNFVLKYGDSNNYGQKYYRRNAKFEPVQSSYDLNKTLGEIAAAFRWGKPAIISTHRINYVGTLDNRHRDFALKELRKLLRIVLDKYPDVMFLTSGEFIDKMHTDYTSP